MILPKAVYATNKKGIKVKEGHILDERQKLEIVPGEFIHLMIAKHACPIRAFRYRVMSKKD